MNFTKFLPIFLVFFMLLISCNNNDGCNKSNDVNDSLNNVNNNTNVEKHLDISVSYVVNHSETSVCGDIVGVDFEVIDTAKVDSLQFWINKEKIFSSNEKKFDYQYETTNEKVGAKVLKVVVFADGKNKEFTEKFVLLSDIIPVKKTYKIIKEFPHDENAYTQGLVYDNGILYEATGLETKSTLRKVDLKTGEVLSGITNQNNVFGEGITVLNDKIIQITWQDHVGIVYEKESLQVLSEFNYNTEGWGLTTDGENLYMSDGTNIIYVLEPNTYSVVEMIPVLDNKERIMYLNELEFIEGYIYANLYTKDFIVKIDPKNGKVLEKIDLTGILPNALYKQNTDVLNGIAYDKENNRIFVTGKNWPKLYQVEFK
ncbi:MAG: glutaminyl-peptide cyclotransferase [Bacteroidales bacterium]|nr:glutaminyl-peptide cyclotransferase [Bacteroidales bacterium]